jgi:hypothetical protein
MGILKPDMFIMDFLKPDMCFQKCISQNLDLSVFEYTVPNFSVIN